MGVYLVDPLTDPRWGDFILRHPRATLFHTREWLSALRQTYGYTPIAFSTSASGEPLENSLVFCDVKSWLTGRRLVSLPFSDHCDPLDSSPEEREEIWAYIREYVARHQCTYAESRPRSAAAPHGVVPPDLQRAETFVLHTLSLDAPIDALFRAMHKDCIQRKIRRAEREALVYEHGRSRSLLHKFFHLQLATRRRHGLPPQPPLWFHHLLSSMGEQLTIRVVSKNDHPVAATVALVFREVVTYKYGCSDEKAHQLGGMPFLFWKMIQEAKEQGMRQLDLGRSEADNPGLVTFKDRLGAKRADLQYYRLASGTLPKRFSPPRRTLFLKQLMHHMPDAAVVAAGRLLYRHMG